MNKNLLLVKVYGDFSPSDDALFQSLNDMLEQEAAAGFLSGGEEKYVLRWHGASVLLGFEGLAFPLESTLRVLESHAARLGLSGRLDYIDMELWSITRFVWAQGALSKKSGSLNAALDYSGF